MTSTVWEPRELSAPGDRYEDKVSKFVRVKPLFLPQFILQWMREFEKYL